MPGRDRVDRPHRQTGLSPLATLLVKAVVSAILIVAASEVARRQPGVGALIASLPLVSVLGMIWLWSAKPDVENMASHVQGTFWYILPSLPMFLVIPVLLRRGMPFWPALGLGCALTIGLYVAMTAIGPRFGLKL